MLDDLRRYNEALFGTMLHLPVFHIALAEAYSTYVNLSHITSSYLYHISYVICETPINLGRCNVHITTSELQQYIANYANWNRPVNYIKVPPCLR